MSRQNRIQNTFLSPSSPLFSEKIVSFRKFRHKTFFSSLFSQSLTLSTLSSLSFSVYLSLIICGKKRWEERLMVRKKWVNFFFFLFLSIFFQWLSISQCHDSSSCPSDTKEQTKKSRLSFSPSLRILVPRERERERVIRETERERKRKRRKKSEKLK